MKSSHYFVDFIIHMKRDHGEAKRFGQWLDLFKIVLAHHLELVVLSQAKMMVIRKSKNTWPTLL